MSMWSILHMTVASFVAVVAPRTGKIIKNGLVTKLEFRQSKKLTFLKGAWHLRGYRKQFV